MPQNYSAGRRMPCFFLALPSELAVAVAIATLDLHLLLLLTNELIVAVLAVLAPKAVADPPNLMLPGPKATSSTCNHRQGHCKRSSTRLS